MKCAICRNGEAVAGKTTVVLEREGSTLLFRNVPAQICDNCGEEYVSADVNRSLLARANEAARRGVDFEMMQASEDLAEYTVGS
jgi:YgiT-type zinc finger domain-containing protein